MKKRAYISVYDKENIEFAAKKLINLGYEILSTGNTYNYLKEKGIDAIESSTVTGFRELLSGKVKSLHPEIFAGILADKDEAKTLNFPPISVVIVNLYPFEEYAQQNAETQTLIKNIDIGGVALLRAGAKNYQNVVVITDKKDYEIDFENIDDKTRENLALKVFLKTSKYDGLIFEALSKKFADENEETLPDYLNYSLIKKQNLRYGENPHQKAALYDFGEKLVDYEVLGGKELSYNNIVDVTAALNIVSEFFDVNAAVIIKHTNPSGVALGKTLEEAWDRALDCDPLSAFGGIVAFSKKVDLNIAQKLTKMFLEVVIAPDFEEGAIEQFKTKKNLRIIKINTPLEKYKQFTEKEIKLTPFGALVQDKDIKELDVETFKVVTKEKPTAEMIEDMVFAQKIAKHLKSNAIVIAKDLKTIGICGGQTSRVGAVEIALMRVTDSAKDAILASDGFFPATDNITVAAQHRIKGIIQPGGSIKDKEVIDLADKLNICMITTGIRHFKH
ncbi:TPA: bifunctional phosphoribosylaminoimidazolecarboxamide formyltransferase/IMP cyclohydrolase [Candidatus Galligastranaerophilus gallistercoris]|nr:bifunctional phosphoribosylaminoimidazolecarboxamide formyltransferase/IMP cyclohydrolase [Candidatus Galligastranaerophilus gallistercoris]